MITRNNSRKRTSVKFGKGTTSISVNSNSLLLIPCDKQEIGSEVKKFLPNSESVVLNFTKTESIDHLIERLEDLKSIMLKK